MEITYILLYCMHTSCVLTLRNWRKLHLNAFIKWMDGIKQGNITTQWPNGQIFIEPFQPLKALHISWGTYFNLWDVFVIYLCLTQNCTQWMYTNHNGKRNLNNTVISNHFTLFFCKRLHSDKVLIVIIFSIDWLEINSGISLAQG